MVNNICRLIEYSIGENLRRRSIKRGTMTALSVLPMGSHTSKIVSERGSGERLAVLLYFPNQHCRLEARKLKSSPS